jgi:hypothetical protein
MSENKKLAEIPSYDDLIQEIENETKGSEKYWATKNEWVKIAGGIVAVIAGLATLGLWFQSILFPLEKLQKEAFNNFFMPALLFSVGFILLFSFALFYFSNMTAKKIASNNVRLIHAIKTLKTSNSNIENQLSTLTEQIETSKETTSLSEKITKNLKQAPIQNLISWAYSLEIEMQCTDVYSFTYSLSWLDKKRIQEIIGELYDNKSHKYTYVYYPTIDSKKNIIKVRKYIEESVRKVRTDNSDITDDTTEDVLSRLIIKEYDKENLPLPGDLSLYDGFNLLKENRCCIVIPIASQVDNIPREEYENYFDAKFEDGAEIDSVRTWFKNVIDG